MKLFIGNLSYDATSQDLEEAFSKFGTVVRVQVVEDRDTGRPRGFGFVEMSSRQEAEKAMQALDGAEIQGRKIAVKPATEKSREGGGGGGGGGGRDGGRERSSGGYNRRD
jgi:cold-inducible RNA-binding protein